MIGFFTYSLITSGILRNIFPSLTLCSRFNTLIYITGIVFYFNWFFFLNPRDSIIAHVLYSFDALSRNHLNASRFFHKYWFKNPALLKKKTNTPWRKITWLLDSYDPSGYSLVDISKKKIPLQNCFFRTSNFNPALQWTDMFWWILKPQSRYNWWKYLVAIFSFYLYYVLIHFKSSTSEK